MRPATQPDPSAPASTTEMLDAAPAPPGSPGVAFALGLGTVVLAAAWFILDGAALHAGARAQAGQSVMGGSALLEQVSQDAQLRLRTEAQLMSEDPRLKSTLATPGIDEATITDVLQDLHKQVSSELLAVLTPTARVRAEVGADYLKNLDLSTSSVVRGAQAAEQPAVGTWVVGDRVLDISAKAIRYDNQLVAYLVVGAPMTGATLKRVHQVTGAGAALLVGGKVALAEPSDGSYPAAFATLANETASFDTQEVTLAGRDYVARLTDVRNTLPRARLALLVPADEALAPYERARSLAYVPVGVAVLFAAVAILRGRLLR